MTSTVSDMKTTHRITSSEASRQFTNSDSGSSTNNATKAAKCSRKNDSQSVHSASMPVSITFISRPECEPPWKESGNCSTCSKYIVVTVCLRRCDSRSACSATSTLQAMMNRPKPTQAPSNGGSSGKL